MSDERFTDEEVRADHFARIDSERDQTRNRDVRRAFAGSDIVAHWLCRGGCGTLCEITQDACEALVVFNTQLRKRGEKPLDTTQIVFCEHCRVVAEADYQRRAESARGEIAWRIRELRDMAPNASREAALVQELKQLGCEGVSELVHAIHERRAAGGKPARRDALR